MGFLPGNNFTVKFDDLTDEAKERYRKWIKELGGSDENVKNYTDDSSYVAIVEETEIELEYKEED